MEDSTKSLPRKMKNVEAMKDAYQIIVEKLEADCRVIIKLILQSEMGGIGTD
jgi:hypothetical protein